MDTAWNDEVEIGELGGHVQGKAVKCHPLFDVYADAGEFAPRRPYARESGIGTRLDAQRSYYFAQQTLVTSKLAAASNLVDLYQALGGDSLYPPPPSP